MWSPTRSEPSLAPTLGYLALAVVAGVFVVDGSLAALTGRLTAPRAVANPPAAIAGGAAALTAEAEQQEALDAESDGGGEGGDEGGDDGVDDGVVALADATAPGQAAASGATPVASGAAAPPLLTEACLEGTPDACRRRALDPFRAALARSRHGDLGRALRLSMFGDSVVATDEIPGRLRHRAVAELGDGGPGFVFAHAPHRFCSHEAITRTVAGTWTTYAVSTSGVRDRWYGFGGSTAQTAGGGVVTRIKGEPITHVAVHYLAQPRGGTVQITGEDPAVSILAVDSRADSAAPKVAQVEVAAGTGKVSLRSEGLVRLFGLVLERDRGAVVDNLGIVSVTAKNFVRNERKHWVSQVRARAPDLVLLMMGANEAQWLQGGPAEMKDYAARFTELLTPIREGGAACLVISPLDQVEINEDRIVSRKIAPRLAEAQRAAAMAAGCGFFDTFSWMGGAGSAVRWRRRGLLGGDYIHLTRKGSEKLGDAVFRVLFEAPSGSAGAAP